MNPHLQKIQDFIQQAETLSAEEKAALAKAVKDTDAELTITEFKLERTEKVKRTTGILLEETIDELEKKRKAVEEKNRELEIEAALERVRARTMAMQKSDELTDVAGLLFKQVTDMGIKTWTAGFNVWSDDNNQYTDYITSPQGGFIEPYVVDSSQTPVLNELRDARKRGDTFFAQYAEGERLKETYLALARFGNQKQYEIMLKDGFEFPSHQYDHFVFGAKVSLMFITYDPVPEAHDIFKRFGKVFEQTYTRFLDLKKAEAQTREAQIEAALEKVRSCSLAMHKSNELRGVVKVVFERLQALEFAIDGAAFIVTTGETPKDVNMWIGDNHAEYPSCFKTPFFNSPVIRDVFDAFESGSGFVLKTYSIAEKNSWFEYAFQHTDYKHLPDELKTWILAQENLTQCFALARNSGVGIHFHNRRPLSDNEVDILKRFSKVFEQSYIRFLDLQKAEEQARESQVQLALERVRARTMAMQHSDELPETSALLFQQVKELGEAAIQNSIAIVNEEAGLVELSTTVHGSYALRTLHVPIDDPYLMAKAVAAWKAKARALTVEFEGEELKNYNELRNSFLETKISFPEDRWIVHISFFSKGWLSFSFDAPVPGEIIDAQKRFAAVFDQTYTRFNDLKQAEEQTREAKIEAALERVRSRTMAMQKSDDLAHAVAIVFEELDKLNFSMLRCGIGILDKQKCSADVWTTTTSEGETIVQVSGDEPMNIHPLSQHAFDVWAKQDEDGDYVLQGEDLNDFYRALTGTNFKLPGSQSIVTDAADYTQYYYVATFQSGNLYAFRDTAFTAEAKTIIKRFANVFDFTYTRFNDLKQAEQQLREAIKQASLDRVRGEIASMRTTKDLERIIPLVWNELTTLDIPFIRCGVFIVDEDAELIHTHLSTPDGKALAAFDLPFDADGIGREVLPAWHKKQMATVHWSAEEFAANTKNLVSQGAIKSRGKYVTERPDTTLDLHFFPFSQGMLYAGNADPLTDDEKNLVQSLADAFSAAYARYEDFNKLELAKQQVEHTLSDLKAAQTKLVQSEKMASLGELTAGIAHEIQNPLNFVNNFSEVNQEMIDELEEELKAGNIEEALAIAADIKQNEEKINHHGKRADSIVKGMLQHSRTSGGEKQPTNINALADEFMRLSYHGLRAKEKSFNANMVTNFDPDLPKIEVVAQDIGRVLLNLFNNAFYAVNQKQKTAGPEYEPQVSVDTFFLPLQGVGGFRVRDNGVGIPDAIRDKIMQPFFTTKPTGEGTGLGLSLTYDMVVKGHGGSIEVNTNEGEFTEFIVSLPIT